MDRESRDPFDLIDEIEKTLALDAAPITWPIGRGRDFIGTIDVKTGGVRLLDGDAGEAGSLREMTIAELAAAHPSLDAAAFGEELDLVRHGCKPLDLRSAGTDHPAINNAINPRQIVWMPYRGRLPIRPVSPGGTCWHS